MENISKATLVGIQVGVGATVAVGQLPKLLGETTNFSGHGFLRSLAAVVEAIPAANPATVALSAGSIAVLLVVRAAGCRRCPRRCIVVAGGILSWRSPASRVAGVELIAPVPQGFPAPELPSFANLGALVPGALAISIMALLESAAVARGIRKPGDRRSTATGSCSPPAPRMSSGPSSQTLPSAGGFSQSAVNQAAGARTQLSSIVTVVLALLVVILPRARC